MEWKRAIQYYCVTQRRDGLKLSVVITRIDSKKWLTMALETFETELEPVLGKHSHHTIATTRTKWEGMELGDKYARSWRRRKPAPDCPCVEISGVDRALGIGKLTPVR